MENPPPLPPNDKPFSTSIRLAIMILLFNHRKINFTELQKLLNLTPGNLDHHLKTLEKEEYIRRYKKLSALRKPLTMIELTPEGKKDFERYLIDLRDLLDTLLST